VREYIEKRAVSIGEYIVESNATVRQAAKKFGVSKSTVHKDVSERLALINRNKASSINLNSFTVSSVFSLNLAIFFPPFSSLIATIKIKAL